VKVIIVEQFCFLNFDEALVKYQAGDGHVTATKQEVKVTVVGHICQKLTKVRCTLFYIHFFFFLMPVSSEVISDNIIFRCNNVTVMEG
jgi:hypothetical protein